MKKVKTFVPGNHIIERNLKRKAVPKFKIAKIKFPGRIHITLIDSNRFDFGEPGAGGMGFSFLMNNEIFISLSDQDSQDVKEEFCPILKHLTYVMKKILCYPKGINVKLNIDKFFKSHKGLGTTTTISTAFVQGINSLFGYPLNHKEVREIISYNYAEEKNGKIIRGTETGVGPFLILTGGFVIVAGNMNVIYSREFFPQHKLILVDPGSVQVSHKESEFIPIMDKIQYEDLAFRYHKSYMILMDLIPALYEDDFNKIGDILWRFQFGGNNLFELEKYPDNGKYILEVMFSLRFGINPKPIVGLSSVGPIIYVITKKVENVKEICRKLDLNFYTTDINNKGIDIFNQN